jgi:hypothetical protein
MRGSKWNLDVAGHYARPDVFRLTSNKDNHPLITVAETLTHEPQSDTKVSDIQEEI